MTRILLLSASHMLTLAVGLSAIVGWLDYFLLPVLMLFIGMILYALWKRRTT